MGNPINSAAFCCKGKILLHSGKSFANCLDEICGINSRGSVALRNKTCKVFRHDTVVQRLQYGSFKLVGKALQFAKTVLFSTFS